MMDKHALALLSDEALWKKMGLTKFEAHHPGFVTSLLFHLIVESQALGGSFLDEFWRNLGRCHPRLKENVNKLKVAPELISERDVPATLFEGIPASKFDYTPIIYLAGEYFTHLGSAFMRPRDCLYQTDPYDETYDDHEDDDHDIKFPDMHGDELDLKLDLKEKGLSDEQILKYSAFNRDGFSCVVTKIPMQYPRRPYCGVGCSAMRDLNVARCRPYFTPIIPTLINELPASLHCIAILAGETTRQYVLDHLFTVGNAMVLEFNARSKFDELLWAVEPPEKGTTQYIYRMIPVFPEPGPLFIKLRDGDEIKFGKGRDSEQLGVGPLPELCRLRLAVTRALGLSGAAGLMGRLISDPAVDTSRSFVAEVSHSCYIQLACSDL